MKEKRHEKILEMIRRKDISTQDELAQQLGKCGFRTTQATISRDIKELQLRKIPGKSGRYKYAAPEMGSRDVGEGYLRILKEGYVSMDIAQNILVVKTGAGLAMAVAATLDALDWDEIVGCIAGDDTVMCAIRSTQQAEIVMKRLLEIVC